MTHFLTRNLYFRTKNFSMTSFFSHFVLCHESNNTKLISPNIGDGCMGRPHLKSSSQSPSLRPWVRVPFMTSTRKLGFLTSPSVHKRPHELDSFPLCGRPQAVDMKST